eukprot:scpid112140/ scgid1117/ 
MTLSDELSVRCIHLQDQAAMSMCALNGTDNTKTETHTRTPVRLAESTQQGHCNQADGCFVSWAECWDRNFRSSRAAINTVTRGFIAVPVETFCRLPHELLV